MKPKTRRALKLLDSFNGGAPGVIETMMLDSGMACAGMESVAARIRTQVSTYVSSISQGAQAVTAADAQTVKVLMVALVAVAKERQFGLSPYGSLN